MSKKNKLSRPKNTEEWESKLGTKFFNPLEVYELQDAIREKKSSVVIGVRKFLLNYYTQNGEEFVYYRPDGREFTPCGHLEIRRFLKGL